MSSSVGRKYWKTNPDAEHAHMVVKRAIANGTLVRPQGCESCPRIHVRILAHHTDYSQPLKVDWWCEKCHRKFHNCVNKLLKLSYNSSEEVVKEPKW